MIAATIASPLKSENASFDAVNSIDFHQHGWRLFGKYLAYMVASNEGTYWNPVAYHLNNACEVTAGSLDAWAGGVSVAVEAVASLISVEGDEEKAERVGLLQDRMRKWFAEQSDLRCRQTDMRVVELRGRHCNFARAAPSPGRATKSVGQS